MKFIGYLLHVNVNVELMQLTFSVIKETLLPCHKQRTIFLLSSYEDTLKVDKVIINKLLIINKFYKLKIIPILILQTVKLVMLKF